MAGAVFAQEWRFRGQREPWESVTEESKEDFKQKVTKETKILGGGFGGCSVCPGMAI
jgi:hypothetical protein